MTRPSAFLPSGQIRDPQDPIANGWEPHEEYEDVGLLGEYSATGLKRSGGMIDEEFLPALRGKKGVEVIREMLDNSSVIGAMNFVITQLLMEAECRVEPGSNSAEDRAIAHFIDTCREDMSHSWAELLAEIASCVPYGWSWHEVVYKVRRGPWESDGRFRSQYTDNRIGWRKMPIRAQESLSRWDFDDDGGIAGIVTQPAPFFQMKAIPIQRSLLFRVGIHKGNPEGRSMYRSAYRDWYNLKRAEEIELVGMERDLAGMPVAKVPAEVLSAKPGSPMWPMKQLWMRTVTGLRRNEGDGVLVPSDMWNDDGSGSTPQYDLSLMASGGSRQFDTSAIIERYRTSILMTCLCDFIAVGHEQAGAYNMHVDKTNLFKTAINAIMKMIGDVFNRHAIPKLLSLNGWRPEKLPKLVFEDIDPPDLQQLMQFMTQAAGLGMVFFPDPKLENRVRKWARLPEVEESREKALGQMQRQAQIIEQANLALQAMQVEQQAAEAQAQTEVAPAMAQQQADQGNVQTALAQEQLAQEQQNTAIGPDKRAKNQAVANPPAPGAGAPPGRPAPARKTASRPGGRPTGGRTPVKKSAGRHSAFGFDMAGPTGRIVR